MSIWPEAPQPREFKGPLMAIASQCKRAFRDQFSRPFVELPTGRCVPTDSELFREYLRRTFKAGDPARPAPGREVLNVICDEVQSAAEEVFPLYPRTATDPETGYLWIDVGDGSAFCVTPRGWYLTKPAVPMFLSYPGQVCLPMPVGPGRGDAKALLGVLNIENQRDQMFALVWIAVAPFNVPRLQHLSFFGPHGTGKTTAARYCKKVFDPAPGDADMKLETSDWRRFDQFDQNAIVMADETGRLTPADEAFLKRCATGCDLRKDGVQIGFRRPCIFTSELPLTHEPGLVDRTMAIELLQPGVLIPDMELRRRFNLLHPTILGGFLDLLVAVLADTNADPLPSILTSPDHHVRARAAAKAMGFNRYPFEIIDYVESRQKNILSGDPLFESLVSFLETRMTRDFGLKKCNYHSPEDCYFEGDPLDHDPTACGHKNTAGTRWMPATEWARAAEPRPWSGTYGQLAKALYEHDGFWISARKLTDSLRGIEKGLQLHGISVTRDRHSETGNRLTVGYYRAPGDWREMKKFDELLTARYPEAVQAAERM